LNCLEILSQKESREVALRRSAVEASAKLTSAPDLITILVVTAVEKLADGATVSAVAVPDALENLIMDLPADI